MVRSLLAYVRTSYPFPYVGGCPDIDEISTFSRIRIHNVIFVKLNAVQNKYNMCSNLVFSGKANEDWFKN